MRKYNLINRSSQDSYFDEYLSDMDVYDPNTWEEMNAWVHDYEKILIFSFHLYSWRQFKYYNKFERKRTVWASFQ